DPDNFLSPNLAPGLAMDDEFWVEHGEELEERFNAWASQ
ncbi:hypothetical protein K3Z92_29290, partial [Pseudomonas aeruginosa]|nr:hypothetical protein [Pseudomonas aeruginosa]